MEKHVGEQLIDVKLFGKGKVESEEVGKIYAAHLEDILGGKHQHVDDDEILGDRRSLLEHKGCGVRKNRDFRPGGGNDVGRKTGKLSPPLRFQPDSLQNYDISPTPPLIKT